MLPFLLIVCFLPIQKGNIQNDIVILMYFSLHYSEKLSSPMDVIFVLDGSYSAAQAGFEEEKCLFSNLTDYLDVAYDKVYI